MKKTLVVIAVLVAALALMGVGAVFAQASAPGTALNAAANGFGPGMMGGRGGMRGGPAHDYVEQAFAARLGLTEADVEANYAAGKTLYQQAIDAGIAEADIQALLKEVHETALKSAVDAGALTQAQADAMLARFAQGGYGNGDCLMTDGGMGHGRGGMGGRGGGRWQGQPAPTAVP